LRGEGATERDATETLKGATVAQKNELLFQRGLNFNDLPSWQKRGVGLYWEDFEKASIDPRNQQEVVAIRRRIRQDSELPLGADYRTLVQSIWNKSEQ
jgi:tRNA(His) 5'-end guanylyltransferase